MAMEIVWDKSDFERGLLRYSAKSATAGDAQMRLNAMDLMREAQELAPLDEGTLAASGTYDVESTPVRVTGSVSFHTPYATKVHYDMAPAPGSRMQPGPGTRGKPGTEFGPAGGLYLQRPLLGKAKRYMKAIADALRRLR